MVVYHGIKTVLLKMGFWITVVNNNNKKIKNTKSTYTYNKVKRKKFKRWLKIVEVYEQYMHSKA